MFGEGENSDNSGNNHGGGGMFSKRPDITPKNSVSISTSRVGFFRPKLADMERALKVCSNILKKI